MGDSRSWAEEQFAHADLGDARRVTRLVDLAAEVASRPAGTVMKACASSSSREGAFRLLENNAVHPEAVRDAIETATLRRCRGVPYVFVAIDGSSLTLTEGVRAKGLGGVGAWKKGARGVQVMTALAVECNGSPLGICRQQMWIRDAKSPYGRRGALGQESENRFWLELLSQTQRAFGEQAQGCVPWFQMDRGADCWQVLASSIKLGLLMTVRAAHDRRTDNQASRLWSTLERAPIRAKQQVHVPARPPAERKKRVGGKRIKYFTPPRRTRIATVAIRAATVPIECTTNSGRKLTINLNAVYVREVNRAGDRLEWMLLTTHPICTRKDLLEVVRGYALRWRIEEFHRLWKRGLCRVEDTQLQSRDAIYKWATILAAVATRAMRITHLARKTPDEPASTEFSRHELAALFALRRPKDIDDKTMPTLAVAVRWIAELGGYTGPWHGPPGATVIGRGLHELLIAARVVEYQSQKR